MQEGQYHDNLISDVNIGFRIQNLNTAGDEGRSVYIYRNRVYLPDGVGEHAFLHLGYGGGSFPRAQVMFYHNDFR